MQMRGFHDFPFELSVHANTNLSHFNCICYHSNIFSTFTDLILKKEVVQLK